MMLNQKMEWKWNTDKGVFIREDGVEWLPSCAQCMECGACKPPEPDKPPLDILFRLDDGSPVLIRDKGYNITIHYEWDATDYVDFASYFERVDLWHERIVEIVGRCESYIEKGRKAELKQHQPGCLEICIQLNRINGQLYKEVTQ